MVRGRVLVLAAALTLGGCGVGGAEAPLLSERAYRAWIKRDCLTAKKVVEQAASVRAVPAVYLQRVADAAQAMQREFARARPPARLRTIHRELVAVGDAQLALIQTALARLERGYAPQRAAELQARNRELVRRANAIAERLGLEECVNDPDGP